ncbi:hypothetical protein GWK47_016325 [Chionoecetes opilio]|uniref:Uncharacterized protein n=1 Tax=Chionoecetes opilio TaxID=41210 RepID=A0A8J5CMK2_CHIOP|nr:hypothetical protein GWK47_016325 [Chionoecetes opilio]
MGDAVSKRLREAPSDIGRWVDFVAKADEAVAAMVQGTHAYLDIATKGPFKLTFKYKGTKIVGLGYDGRKDKTRAMVPDSYGKLHPRLIREEHVSVTEEPSGRYLWHFVPEDPVPPEKPAFKVAQALYHLLVTYDSTDSLIVLQVCSLLSSVNEMQYNARVQRSARRWLTTAQSLVYMWTRKHGLTSKELNTLEILVKYCLQVYFKLYYDIKVHRRLEDGPKHILTQLRVMRSQPKKVQTVVTFYVRTGEWFAHSECVLLSLMASQSEDDRRFAVTQILILKGWQGVWGHQCKTSHHTQAELVSHQLADTDQLAAWPGARAGIHLFTVRGSDPGDHGQAVRGSGVLYPHSEHRKSREAEKKIVRTYKVHSVGLVAAVLAIARPTAMPAVLATLDLWLIIGYLSVAAGYSQVHPASHGQRSAMTREERFKAAEKGPGHLYYTSYAMARPR